MPKYIMDTADVTLTRKSDRHTIFTAEAQLASLSQTVDEETIQGGIGSRNIYTIRSNKSVELTVRNATFDEELLATTQGVAIDENGSAILKKNVKATVEDDGSGGLSVTADGIPAETEVSVVNSNRVSNRHEVGVDGNIILTEGDYAAGEKVVIIYEEEVTGRKISIRSDKFGENYEVQYMTYVYDSKTGKRLEDAYINFGDVTPSSSFDMSLENGTAFTPEITFTANANEDGEIGSMLFVPVEE